MNNIKIIIFFLLVLVTNISNGQRADTLEYPIDKKCNQCLEKEITTTTGMMQCFSMAREEWGLEITKYYDLLMQKLKPEQKEKLIASQEAWMNYKEAEFNLSNYIYYDEEQGQEKKIDAASRQAQFFKQRALDLMQYYDLYLQR